jgi:bifunctional non-homologous end joining protein LigD
MNRVTIGVGGQRVTLSNLDRVLWPATGFTKRAMLDYYRQVAPALLPHLRDRAVTLARFPEGVTGQGWYQANCRGAPAWVRTHEVRGRTGGLLRYCVLDDLPSLMWAANIGTIELHPFLSTVSRPEEPRAVVFDLDPGSPATLADCVPVALGLRERLEPLRSFPKLSGHKGLHVIVPVTGATFDDTKSLARGIAAELAATDPSVTDRSLRSERVGSVLVDWAQNDPNRSLVAPYSLRATPVPSVSAPLTWEEVERLPSEGLRFGPEQSLRRLDDLGDPFAEVAEVRQRLPARAEPTR